MLEWEVEEVLPFDVLMDPVAHGTGESYLVGWFGVPFRYREDGFSFEQVVDLICVVLKSGVSHNSTWEYVLEISSVWDDVNRISLCKVWC